ncbi:hypothetical protein Taro_037394 [Colocasia esculenta]|uniref:Uncharacterized protein n=1 Tax=Colocasia esculenta TaxID=4460 RepID=A0A843WCP8_COLES|nr:hypothetical protein [Colocasia esculenta]
MLQALRVLSGHTLMEAPISTNAASMATLFIVNVTHKGIFLASGAANSPSENGVVEQVGGLEQAGFEAWGCGLCQGHLSDDVAAATVAVAGTVVGRAVTVVVVVAVVVVVVAAIASAVVDVVSNPRESKGIQGHEGCKDIGQRLGQRRILGSLGSVGLSGGIVVLRWRDLGILALVLRRVLTLRKLLSVVTPWLLRLLSVWGPTHRALGVTHSTHLLIGLDPFNNWALRLLGVTGFRGLEHGVYRRVLELGLNETGSTI